MEIVTFSHRGHNVDLRQTIDELPTLAHFLTSFRTFFTVVFQYDAQEPRLKWVEVEWEWDEAPRPCEVGSVHRHSAG